MLHELPKAQIVARVDYLITEFHLEPFIDKLARKLSKGMKQKVAIARAIVHDPSIILFDEPEAGLDFCAAKRTFDFLLKCRNEGKTVIFCSHSLKSIREFSNRLIVLNHGVLVNTLEMDELRAARSNKEMNKLLFDLVKKRAG